MLITGAAGQLGRDLAVHCRDLGDMVVAVDRASLDITDRDAVAVATHEARPDVIVNCAAWTAVDACEAEPERAHAVNAEAVSHLAAAAREVGAHLVQISTDYVFSGEKSGAYVETDPTGPRSVYGASKLAGEELAGPNATIVRTSWVCSGHGNNMVATVLRLAAEHPTLRFVDDQVGRPTFTPDLAVAVRNLAVDRVAGVVHVCNHGRVSWFEFAQAVLRAAGHDAARVEPIATADLDPPRPAARPANSELSTEKYEALGYAALAHFEVPLATAVTAY